MALPDDIGMMTIPRRALDSYPPAGGRGFNSWEGKFGIINGAVIAGEKTVIAGSEWTYSSNIF